MLSNRAPLAYEATQCGATCLKLILEFIFKVAQSFLSILNTCISKDQVIIVDT